MSEQTNVTNFPKPKIKSRGPKSDEDLVKAIHAAQRALCRAIEAATEAGLEVSMHLDAKDTYAGGKVRCHDAKVSRVYK